MRRDRVVRRVVTPFAVAFGLVASVGVTAAHAEDWRVTAVAGDAGGQAILDHASDFDLDLLALPQVPPAMEALASRIEDQFGGDPRFASVVYSDSRTRLSVYWYGDAPSDLANLADSAQSFDVEIAPAVFDPEALRGSAVSIFESWPGVAGVAMQTDASGLIVNVYEDRASSRAAIALSKELPFPVEVREQSFVPASRQSDTSFLLGGARISRFEDPWIRGQCTSGFAARGENRRNVILTAAHCGDIGSQWIVTSGQFAIPWGPMTRWAPAFDGALIDTGWSQPGVWIGPWDSNTFHLVHGSRTPRPGQELCLSGSFSGLVCGNIVRQVNFSYSLGVPGLTNITGFISENLHGTPAAGNGDSGGPAFEVVSSPTGTRLYAVGIISAIPAGSPPVCQGVPGSSAVNGRRCSPTVISTSVLSIAGALGVHVATLTNH